jgi:para-nitrobenzyl esterase
MNRIAGAILAATLMSAPAHAQPVSVKTATGIVAGQASDRANAFLNIPFAAAPVGALRWAPPQPAPAWTGARDATKAGPSCLQLNIFTPRAAKGAPVMVWIHGGGHRTGAGWIYDGQNFARDGVVVVSINYRLGALGYFAHPALTKAAGGQPTGNFGLMDQVAALKWVQKNIAAFGGDPKNVTVFGESAGGMSILALLATPSAKGLYAKAIVQSGAGWFEPKTLADKEKEGAAALARLGVTETATAADLRAIPFERLVPVNGDYQPFIDGKLMTATASQALARGTFADVPLMIGSNSGEDSLMGPAKQTMASLARFGGEALKPVYPEEAAKGEDTLARAMFTDRVMGGPARWVAAQASAGRPSWLYYFSYVGARFRPAVTTSAHAAEIQYVWEYWGRRTPMSVVSDEDRAMASLMHACWVSFAKTSTPRCGPEAWPAYDAKSDRLMEFGAASGVRTNFRKSQLDAQQAAALPGLKLAK